MKAKIFSLLSPLERQQIRPVCTDWKELIDEEFGIKLRVNNGTAEILGVSSEFAVELELNSLTVPVDITGMIFTNKLHTLRFHNIVVTYNLFPYFSCASEFPYYFIISFIMYVYGCWSMDVDINSFVVY